MSDNLLPAGRLVKVEFEVRLPVAATQEQVEDWIGLELGCRAMSNGNPLAQESVEVYDDLMLTDTRMQGHREEFDHRTEGSTIHYKVRNVRTAA